MIILISLCCIAQGLFASNPEDNGLFTAAHVRAAFQRDGRGFSEESQGSGVAEPLAIAQPAVQVGLTFHQQLLAQLIANSDRGQLITGCELLHPFLVRSVQSKIIVTSKIGGKKRRLKESKNALIDPALDQASIYSQAYEQGVVDAQALIERYAEIILKDEVEVLKKQISDEAYQNGYEKGCQFTQEKFVQEKENRVSFKKRKI